MLSIVKIFRFAIAIFLFTPLGSSTIPMVGASQVVVGQELPGTCDVIARPTQELVDAVFSGQEILDSDQADALTQQLTDRYLAALDMGDRAESDVETQVKDLVKTEIACRNDGNLASRLSIYSQIYLDYLSQIGAFESEDNLQEALAQAQAPDTIAEVAQFGPAKNLLYGDVGIEVAIQLHNRDEEPDPTEDPAYQVLYTFTPGDNGEWFISYVKTEHEL